MSAYAWFGEVNEGLVGELRRTIRVLDGKGAEVPIRPESVVVRKPEEDFKIEAYPCVSVYNRTYRHAPLRHGVDPEMAGFDYAEGVVTLEDPPAPFDLSYQIDFWAKYQTDMDLMTSSWLAGHHRQFNLPVAGATANCLARDSIVRSDLVKGNERLLHSVATLEIWVELRSGTRYDRHMVADIGVGAREKKGGAV